MVFVTNVVVILLLCSLVDQPFLCIKSALKLDTNRHNLQEFAQISVQYFGPTSAAATSLPSLPLRV